MLDKIIEFLNHSTSKHFTLFCPAHQKRPVIDADVISNQEIIKHNARNSVLGPKNVHRTYTLLRITILSISVLFCVGQDFFIAYASVSDKILGFVQ